MKINAGKTKVMKFTKKDHKKVKNQDWNARNREHKGISVFRSIDQQ